ncbi:hypothetical protein D3C84_578920 [compost metagenome]
MEQPLQLAHRHLVELGEFFQFQRLLQIGLHDRDYLAQLRLGIAELLPQGHALLFAGAAHAVAEQQFGGAGGDLHPVRFAGDQLQGHVHGRGAAGAGVAVAVQLEQLIGDDDAGEPVLELLDVFPVDGAAVALEQVRAGQQVAAGTDAAQRHMVLGQLAQPVEQVAVVLRRDRVGTDHEQRVQLGGVVDRVIRHHAHAVAGAHRLVVGGDQQGAVEGAFGGQVGHAQGLDRAGEADRGEVGTQQETKGLHLRARHRGGLALGRCQGGRCVCHFFLLHCSRARLLAGHGPAAGATLRFIVVGRQGIPAPAAILHPLPGALSGPGMLRCCAHRPV